MVQAPDIVLTAIEAEIANTGDPMNMYRSGAASGFHFRPFKDGGGSGQFVDADGNELQFRMIAQLTEKQRLGPKMDLFINGGSAVTPKDVENMKFKLTVGVPASVDSLPLEHSKAARVLLKNMVTIQTATNAGRTLPANYSALVKTSTDGRTAILTIVGGKLWLNPRSRSNGGDGGGRSEEDFATLLVDDDEYSTLAKEDENNKAYSNLLGDDDEDIMLVDSTEKTAKVKKEQPSTKAVNGVFEEFTLKDWADPDGVFAHIEDKHMYKMSFEPPITRLRDGSPIHPADFESALVPGTWMVLDVKLRLWSMPTGLHYQYLLVGGVVLHRGIWNELNAMASGSGSSTPSSSPNKRKREDTPVTPARPRAYVLPGYSPEKSRDEPASDDVLELAAPETPTPPAKRARTSKGKAKAD